MYHKTVGETKKGDLVVHYRKPHVVAFSRAQENGRFFEQLPLLQGEDYGAGWRFHSQYFVLKNQVNRESFTERLIPLRIKHYPINSVGHIRQGYFFPFNHEGLRVVLSEVVEDLPAWLEENEIRVDAPGRTPAPAHLRERTYRSRRVDHAALDAANRLLGSDGEKFVVEYERTHLRKRAA